MAPGLVTIKRKKGRIAGFGAPSVPTEILWCGTNRPRKKFGQRRNGWSFPPAVRELLLNLCAGKTALHLFGGRADFGVRLDIDPSTQPDVVGDAWLPPFGRDSFDIVILDPPYFTMQQQEKLALMRAAAWIARDRVIWFHTVWIPGDRSLQLVKSWLVRVGDQCSVRCIQDFKVRHPKLEPMTHFERGPAMKYNRWLAPEQNLPLNFGSGISPNDLAPAANAIDANARRQANDIPASCSGVKSRPYAAAVKSARSSNPTRGQM